MRIAITGSSGLIGRALTRSLRDAGHEVVRVVRSQPRSAEEIGWDPDAGRLDPDALRGTDAVVHLAGESINGRWTSAKKRAIRESRVKGTSLLSRALSSLAADGDTGPGVLVSSSAIGYYGSDRGDQILTEESSSGSGFLAEVCRQWEDATRAAEEAGLRVVHVRTGIVQSPEGGQLGLQLPLFKLGLGGRLGSGRQWLSWITIDDIVGVYEHALASDDLRGPVNGVAPEPVRNRTYTNVLARVVRRPAPFVVPKIGPAVLLGSEGADEVAMANQRVHPAVAERTGYAFTHTHLEPALRAVLGRPAPAADRTA